MTVRRPALFIKPPECIAIARQRTRLGFHKALLNCFERAIQPDRYSMILQQPSVGGLHERSSSERDHGGQTTFHATHHLADGFGFDAAEFRLAALLEDFRYS